MPYADREHLTGDMPVAPAHYSGEVKPSVSPDVIATYVVDAVRPVPGVAGLHGSTWQDISSRVRESHTKGVVIHDLSASAVALEIHVRVAWGVTIPDLAQSVEDAVRERIRRLLDLDVSKFTLFVDEIEGPSEVAPRAEG
jgi:uncharacterized alkaline shock family protein YloU